MSEPALPALLAWNRAENQRWHAWFRDHPAALDLPLGAGSAGTIRSLIRHVFAVDMRYAQRLLGLPVSSLETIDAVDVDSLFALAARANEMLTSWLAGAGQGDLAHRYTFMTLSAGERSASARKSLIHTCTHQVRH